MLSYDAFEREHQARLETRDFGVVEGVVRSVSGTREVTIVLYDDIFNKRVECLLNSDRAEEAREIYRKRVRVYGTIERNPDTGTVNTVRNVTRIELADSNTESAFLRARGALDWEEGDKLPEITIRRLRDGKEGGGGE